MRSLLKPDVILSAISIIIAIIVYLSSRKTFMLEIANRRAEKVNSVFKEISKNMRVAAIDDDHYLNFWPEIISEMIITINIIESLSGKYWVSKFFVGYKDVCYVFWEQLHTSIRTHFDTYKSNNLVINKDDSVLVQTRKAQLQTIIRFYQKVK